MNNPGDNSRYMRAWTKCYMGRPTWRQATGDFVWYFRRYERWFGYCSVIAPGRRMRWRKE